MLDDADAAQLTTLQGAHPTAKVVRDRAQVDAAFERVFGDKRPRCEEVALGPDRATDAYNGDPVALTGRTRVLRGRGWGITLATEPEAS